MDNTYISEKKFEKINFREKPLNKADYENCQFINCDFSETGLPDVRFTDCEFTGCNLSLAKLTNYNIP